MNMRTIRTIGLTLAGMAIRVLAEENEQASTTLSDPWIGSAPTLLLFVKQARPYAPLIMGFSAKSLLIVARNGLAQIRSMGK